MVHWEPLFTSNTCSPSSHNGRSHGSTTCTTCTTSTAVMGRQVSPYASLLHTQPLRTPSTASSTSLACHRDRLETLHHADAPHRSRSAHDSRVLADGVGPQPCDQGAEEHEMAKKMPVAVATFRCGAHGMQMLATCSRACCWPALQEAGLMQAWAREGRSATCAYRREAAGTLASMDSTQIRLPIALRAQCLLYIHVRYRKKSERTGAVCVLSTLV